MDRLLFLRINQSRAISPRLWCFLPKQKRRALSHHIQHWGEERQRKFGLLSREHRGAVLPVVMIYEQKIILWMNFAALVV
jgi:hypothetical protein